MTPEQKEAVKRLVANVASNEINKKRDKTLSETDQFIQNKNNFLYWLASKLEGINTDRLSRKMGRSKGDLDIWVFCYAIENPESFAQILIETLEEG